MCQAGVCEKSSSSSSSSTPDYSRPYSGSNSGHNSGQVHVALAAVAASKQSKYDVEDGYGGNGGNTSAPPYVNGMAYDASGNAYDNGHHSTMNGGGAPHTVGAPESSLPAPWQAVPELDAAGQPTGNHYYHNTATNEVSWSHPSQQQSVEPAHGAVQTVDFRQKEDMHTQQLTQRWVPAQPIDFRQTEDANSHVTNGTPHSRFGGQA